VDDIILTGTNNSEIEDFIKQLQSTFQVRHLETLSYFLGIQATLNMEGLHLKQSKYISDLLDKTQMIGARPLSTSITSGPKLSTHEGELLNDPIEYRQVIGALQYCTLTRPDISYAVNQLCQFMHAPREPHWIATKRVLHYLKGTIDCGIHYTQSTTALDALCDADWAENPDDRKSTNGYIVFLGQNLIS